MASQNVLSNWVPSASIRRCWVALTWWQRPFAYGPCTILELTWKSPFPNVSSPQRNLNQSAFNWIRSWEEWGRLLNCKSSAKCGASTLCGLLQLFRWPGATRTWKLKLTQRTQMAHINRPSTCILTKSASRHGPDTRCISSQYSRVEYRCCLRNAIAELCAPDPRTQFCCQIGVLHLLDSSSTNTPSRMQKRVSRLIPASWKDTADKLSPMQPWNSLAMQRKHTGEASAKIQATLAWGRC